jgi:thiamine biosynthesis lipoprotein ApbE
VIVADAARPADAAVAAAMAKRALLVWHQRFSRFDPGSELSRLNGNPAATVAVSPLMGRVIEAALTAAHDTGGLVDVTLADEIELAGYEGHFDGEGTGGAGRSAAPGPRRTPPRPTLAPDHG